MGNSISSLIQNYLYTHDEKYFDELLEKFSPLIKSYAHKLYFLEYADSVQELSIALFEAITKMKTTTDEYACISYIKKSIIHKFTKLYHESIDAQSRQSANVNMEDSNISDYSDSSKTENHIILLDLLNYLKTKTPLEQQIIVLISQGYSDSEIGEKLGFSRQYINRIKKKILPTDIIK